MKFVATIAVLFGVGAALVAQTERFTVAPGFAVSTAPQEKAPAKRWDKSLLPKDARPYTPTRVTQSIYILDNRDRIDRVPIKDLEKKWHQSGGMEGIEFKSEKFRLVPGKVRTFLGDIRVKNSLGYYQPNRGIRREYPAGTRFDDVLSNKDGVVFEHRTRTKDEEGFWTSEVVYRDEAARPKGYTGLKVTCGSCHGEAGSGEYGVGLVPGGDGVLSDELDWSLVDPSPSPQPGPQGGRVLQLPVERPAAAAAGPADCPT